MSRTIHHVSKINPYDLCTIADVGDVPFYRIWGKRQFLGDLGVRKPFGDEVEHLQFTWCEWVEYRLIVGIVQKSHTHKLIARGPSSVIGAHHTGKKVG